MIWKIKVKPSLKEWDTIIVKKFAFFPVRISENRMVWLQTYYAKRVMLPSELGPWWTDLTRHRYATLDEVEIGGCENLVSPCSTS